MTFCTTDGQAIFHTAGPSGPSMMLRSILPAERDGKVSAAAGFRALSEADPGEDGFGEDESGEDESVDGVDDDSALNRGPPV